MIAPADDPRSILVLHNRYRQRGGEDVMFEAESELLERHGHRVERLVLDSATIGDGQGPAGKLSLAARTVWSRESAHELRGVIRRFRPDVVHAHNTFPLLSPSVYDACAAERAPVVQTLHNFRLICPKATLFRDGRPCNDCVGRLVAWPGVAHACYQGSRPRSAVIAAMLGVARLRGTFDTVTFIALSEFARERFIEGGLPRDRLHVKTNFLDPDPGGRSSDEGTFVFAGRLAEEKGVDRLLDAWRTLPPHIILNIIGDGPLRPSVERAAAALPNVRYRGSAERPIVLEAMRAARAVVVPSQWYEVAPVSVLEAFASGAPVIASRLGSLPELVHDGKQGLLFDPSDAEALSACVRVLHEAPARAAALGERARATYLERYDGESNYARLMEIYRLAVDTTRRLTAG
jgi:glycosyltransferase involved in cell wall biosynthesis